VSLADLRERSPLTTEDLRTIIKVGALDSVAEGLTRPQMLWMVDAEKTVPSDREPQFLRRCAAVPLLPEYTDDRRRRTEYELLGFVTDHHPMSLYEEQLKRFHTVKSTELNAHVGRTVVMAGMLTTAKPVRTINDEPMEFATFDDGHGLVECVLFPDVYRERAHVLFDQGPFLFRGLVEEEFGAYTVTVQQIERLERMLARMGKR
jgi:DNA polymerase III alpha subunit